MCKIAEYPGLYSRANEILRREGMNCSIPGYEFIRRALVIYKVEEKISNALRTRGICGIIKGKKFCGLKNPA